MKILQLGKFYPIRGGVEKVMWEFVNGLSERGVDCDMLCAILEKKERIIRLNEHGRCICVPALTKKAATMISPAMIVWLRKHCCEYDIIHVHHPDPMAFLSLFLSGYKDRVIVHWHSDILKQKTLLKLIMPLQNWVLRRADLVLGTTPVYVRESVYLSNVQKKCGYLPIGVNKISINKEKVVNLRELCPNKKIVFSLGRLVEYKGYSYLVEAAKYLPDDYLVVIGGEGPLYDALKRQIENEGLSGKVLLTGYLSEDDVHNWMGVCSVFVLSSIMKTEAFAIVQVEAMSAGKPVVATRIPGSGVPWVNADGESGRNVPVRDSKALADAILELTSDNVIYGQYAKRAQNRYESLFTREKMIDDLMKIYQL